MASGTGTPSPSKTRQIRRMCSPLASGVASIPSNISVRPKWKNGPTVCDGLGIRSMLSLKGGGLSPPQDNVELIAKRPLRLRRFQVEPGNQPLPAFLVGDGLKDWIKGEERIAGKIHLGDQPCRERRT